MKYYLIYNSRDMNREDYYWEVTRPKYKPGINYNKDGIYFTTEDNILSYIDNGDTLYQVEPIGDVKSDYKDQWWQCKKAKLTWIWSGEKNIVKYIYERAGKDNFDWGRYSYAIARYYPEVFDPARYNWDDQSEVIARWLPEKLDPERYNWDEGLHEVALSCPKNLEYCTKQYSIGYINNMVSSNNYDPSMKLEVLGFIGDKLVWGNIKKGWYFVAVKNSKSYLRNKDPRDDKNFVSVY